MSRGSKDKYSDKQKRKAEHIEEGYEAKGVAPQKAAQIAWATVNKQSGGGEKSGSGRAKSVTEKSKARKSSAERAAKTRRAGGRSSALENQTKQILLERARRKNIAGRSSMNKADLIVALRSPRA